MDALYASELTVRSASAFGSPDWGAATIGRGSEPSAGRAQSAASSTSRAGGVVGRGHCGGIDLARGARLARLGHHHVVDQDDALAPVVEGAELPDDDERGVGMPQVVVRGVGEALDLAHHVVAEIPHQPSVQRRQAGKRR
jgi:hypothetical protein